ncbi:aminotransferase [Cantharellus anzutake]|uniref:aminotransferase n=1 Tax=Cantharellus anzutake TaxID=1750568 RepID=UPI001907B7D8|nr:aminotransferase [Cantharellus anzutake]KAF8310904.1 aminotransferase [Cantharellus anzutake]
MSSTAVQNCRSAIKAQQESRETPLRDIDPDSLVIQLSGHLKSIPLPETLRFGDVCTDHMLEIDYDPATGWSVPVIKPYASISLDPACSIFHYTPALFEGMKAYLGPSGKPLLFRPGLNMKRMAASTARLALPAFNTAALLILIKKLVVIDKRWIPSLPGYSLYIRPTLIGTRPSLGVAPSSHAKLFVILSPTGPYFPSGFKPISLYAEYDAVRSWPGGTGAYKLGINYTPCFQPQAEANRHITEVGQMNFFIVVKRSDGDLDVITPPLDGTILPGVTRASVIALGSLLFSDPALQRYALALKGKRLRMKEESITMPRLRSLSKSGELVEAFGASTAAIIAPIGRIGYEEADILLPVHEEGLGPVAGTFYRTLIAIQEGKVDWGGWSVSCE